MYALIRSEDAVVGLMSPGESTRMPYSSRSRRPSLSPLSDATLVLGALYGTETNSQVPHLAACLLAVGTLWRDDQQRREPSSAHAWRLRGTARSRPLDRTSAALLSALAHERADVDDPLTFLPEIFAQSSGLVVLGRSSLSLYSCLMDSIMSPRRMPWPSPEISRLIASFFARLTMFSIIAPEEKSLKYKVSLSPFWYVTSRKRFSSSAGTSRRPSARS